MFLWRACSELAPSSGSSSSFGSPFRLLFVQPCIIYSDSLANLGVLENFFQEKIKASHSERLEVKNLSMFNYTPSIYSNPIKSNYELFLLYLNGFLWGVSMRMVIWIQASVRKSLVNLNGIWQCWGSREMGLRNIATFLTGSSSFDPQGVSLSLPFGKRLL